MIGTEILDDETRRGIADSMGGDLDIGEQDPIDIPSPVGGSRDPERQATDELLTPRASQDPTMPMTAAKQAPAVNALPAMPAGMPPQAPPKAAPESRGFDWARAFFAAGGGDIGAFDAERNRRLDAPAKAQREEQERQLGQEKLNAFSLQKQKARDAIDPGSKDSLAAQEEFAALMNGRAQQLKDKHPTLAAEFEAYAKKAPTMHAVAIERAMKNPRMAEVLRQIDSESRNDLASANLGVKREALGATIADKTEDNAMKRSELGLKKSELDLRRQERSDVRDERRGEIQAKKDEKIPGDTHVDEHVDAIETTKSMKRALELLPKVSYIGGGAKAANAIFSALPGALDLRTPEDREFANLMQTISAPERHRLFGTALSKGEDIVSQELLPSLGKNKETAAVVLKKMKANLDARISRQRVLYPGLNKVADGSDSSASLPTASKPPAPPAGTQPGLIRRNKATGARWQWDGTDWQAL